MTGDESAFEVNQALKGLIAPTFVTFIIMTTVNMD